MGSKYWMQRHHEEVAKAKTFSELLAIANDIIDSMPGPVVLVSGPISSGGRGSITENLKALEDNIFAMEMRGENVWNQLPFENKFSELAKGHEGYFMPILEEFFLPIFKSGKIKKIWFMTGWETSTGATWEYEQAKKLRIEIGFID